MSQHLEQAMREVDRLLFEAMRQMNAQGKLAPMLVADARNVAVTALTAVMQDAVIKPPAVCPACAGDGWKRCDCREGCERCQGTGRAEWCEACNGAGYVSPTAKTVAPTKPVVKDSLITETALLPCPFCGGKVRLGHVATEEESDYIDHEGQTCGLAFSNFYTDGDIAALWNTRVIAEDKN